MHRRVTMPSFPIAALGLALALGASPLFAANVVVDNLELVSYGNYDATTGRFPVTSRLAFDLSVGGGEKFAGLIRLNFLSTQVESDLATLQGTLPSTATLPQVITRANAPGLGIKTVAVTAKRIADNGLRSRRIRDRIRQPARSQESPRCIDEPQCHFSRSPLSDWRFLPAPAPSSPPMSWSTTSNS